MTYEVHTQLIDVRTLQPCTVPESIAPFDSLTEAEAEREKRHAIDYLGGLHVVVTITNHTTA